mgnify:CR=1 FL=1
MTPAQPRLGQHEAHRRRAGQLWAFSKEVDTKYSPRHRFGPGDAVQVADYRGKFTAHAYINRRSRYCRVTLS